jgi:hypothetical protein
MSAPGHELIHSSSHTRFTQCDLPSDHDSERDGDYGDYDDHAGYDGVGLGVRLLRMGDLESAI